MSFTPFALPFPDSYPIFRKTQANCSDKVEISPLPRKLKKSAPEKFRGRFFLSSVAVVVAAGNDQIVTLTKARPTHKHSQHSHSFSHYRCMVHGWVTALIGSRTVCKTTFILTDTATSWAPSASTASSAPCHHSKPELDGAHRTRPWRRWTRLRDKVAGQGCRTKPLKRRPPCYWAR